MLLIMTQGGLRSHLEKVFLSKDYKSLWSRVKGVYLALLSLVVVLIVGCYFIYQNGLSNQLLWLTPDSTLIHHSMEFSLAR